MGPATVRMLNGERVYCRLDNPAIIANSNSPEGLNPLVWNVTIDSLGQTEQGQEEAAVTFWVTVEDGQIQMVSFQGVQGLLYLFLFL